MYGKAHKGKFQPKNPKKYRGDVTKIIYRSSWEFKMLVWADTHPSVLQYSSEEVVIPYISPIDGRAHRYFVDFLLKIKKKDGKVETVLVEVKPFIQTKEPVRKNQINRTYIREVFTWGVNCAKWEAARKYCEKKDWKFHILTEKELNIKW